MTATPAIARPLLLGNVPIGMRAVQAALSGYSDLPMRRIARRHGAPYCLHEVVLDRTVLTRGRLQRQLLDLPPDDHPVGGQLMGALPADFGRAARLLADAGYDVIDVNFGCPVPSVLGRCRGGYLVGDPDSAIRIVDAVLDAVGDDRPVTLKMRRGIDATAESERAFFTILDAAFERGVAAVTVHPRTVVQRYVGPSDWSFLARCKRHVGERTLLGSGDLFTPRDVLRMLDTTGVDGVTIARGCIGNPWIFGQVADLLAGRAPRAPSIGEQRRTIEDHVRETIAHHGPAKGFGRARTQAIKYAAAHPDGSTVRDAFAGLRSAADLDRVLDAFYPAARAAERAADVEEHARLAQQLRGGGVAGVDPAQLRGSSNVRRAPPSDRARRRNSRGAHPRPCP